MTFEVNVDEAKTHLSSLLARVAGEEIVITDSGMPLAGLFQLFQEH